MNWGTDKRRLKLLNFSTCPNTPIRKACSHISRSTALQHPLAYCSYSVTQNVDLYISVSLPIITLIKKKIPSVQQRDLLGMKYTNAWSATCASKAKQSHQLVLPTRKQKKWLSSLHKKEKTKWTSPCPWSFCWTAPGFSTWSRHLCTSMMEQLSWKFSDMLQPLWHEYSTLHTASFQILDPVE